MRLRPRRIRTRLAILYAVLFLIAGSALSALTYGLLASRLPAPAKVAPNARLLAECKHPAQLGEPQKQPLSGKLPAKPGAPRIGDGLLEKCRLAFAAGARAGSQDQRDHTLTTLLEASLIGLGVATLASAALGWFVSGRALRPVRSITDTARRASELQLGERLALSGPDDELKELAVAAEDALDAAAPAIAERGLSVDAVLGSASVRGDRVLVERMIGNLVDNAVRHNSSGGWIHLRTSSDGDAARFEIANTGPEVPAELIATLFEPFGRAVQRLNPADGVGLGLSIARAIAVAHGAVIAARPRDGGGLELSVELPPSTLGT